jgi:raffinose/stachyose/melibiose transport system substrate-binding protein
MTYPKNKQFYSTPGELTPQAIYYNKKLFRNLGIPEPTSFAEVLAAAKRLKAAGIAPIAVTGTYPPYMFMWPAYLLLRDVGYSATNAAFTCKRPFASLPGVYSAFDSLESVSRYLLPGFEGTDYLNAQLAFFQDKAGMILMGSWLIGEMKDKIPAGFEVGTIPFPRTGGRGSQVDVIGDVNTMVVAAKSKNPELGAKFLQFYASKKQDAYRNRVLGNISAYRGQPAPPGFEGIVAALNQGGGFVPGNLGVGGLEKKYQDAIFEPVTRLFFGKTDGAGAVAEIDQGLRQACGN